MKYVGVLTLTPWLALYQVGVSALQSQSSPQSPIVSRGANSPRMGVATKYRSRLLVQYSIIQ